MFTLEEIEQLCIGGIIACPDKILELQEVLSFEDFISPQARLLYQILITKYKASDQVNLQSLFAAIPASCHEWLIRAESEGFPSNALQFAGDIKEAAHRRRMTAALKALPANLSSSILAEKLQEIAAMRQQAPRKNVTGDELIEHFRDEIERNRQRGSLGISTGFKFLDAEYIQYRPGNLWLIIGYTSTGKTTLAIEMLSRLLDEPSKPVIAYFSTEMLKEMLLARLISCRTGFNANVVLSGHIYEGNRQKISVQEEYISNSGLHIYDDMREWDKIENEIRKLCLQKDLKIVIIDFIQNLTYKGISRQYEALSALARTIQSFLLAQKITGICLSQINNEEGREDSGILGAKGSGEFDAACDIGIRIKRKKDEERLLLWDTRKNRHGSRPMKTLYFKDGWGGVTEEIFAHDAGMR